MSAKEGVVSGLRLDEALSLLAAAPHGLAILAPDGRVTFANEACARLLAHRSPDELVGRSWGELLDAPEAERVEREGLSRARAGETWSGEAALRRHDGVHVPVALRVTPLGAGQLAVSLDDVSAERELGERLRALAHHDTLTGLPNRRLFEDRLEIALAQAHRYRHRVALFFIDLDRFKQVNDALGQAAGDELLCAVAERLLACVREGDTVARLGGDEFTLLLPGIHYAEDLAAISRKLSDSLREPFRVAGRELSVTASAGISLYPEDGEEVEALLKSADTAMYRAKERGRDNFQLFSAAMTEKALERRSLEDDMRKALDRQELTLHYQPCLQLATGRVTGVEALLRWMRPEHGVATPRDFMALADASDVMLAVGPWVLETACAQAREWQRRGTRGLRLMVNLSAHELQQEELVVHVEKALAASGLAPDALQLEIPEGYAMRDLSRTVATLRELRAVGVHLAIDGFGTGFTSLARLRQLPVDTLKIDLSFVRGATSDADDASVVTGVIAVAHSLGLRVVAQGIESEAQVALLALARLRRGAGLPVEPARAAGRVRADPGARHVAGAAGRTARAGRGAAPSARAPEALSRASASRFVEPGRAVGVELLLPDRHLRLERVDRETAGGERLGAMRRRDRHRDTRLADLERAEPVDEPHRGHRKALARLAGDLLHQRQRHLLVGLVLETHDGAPAVLVADDAHEQAECTVSGRRLRERRDVYRLAHQAHQVGHRGDASTRPARRSSVALAFRPEARGSTPGSRTSCR